jgi:hypothetical protein
MIAGFLDCVRWTEVRWALDLNKPFRPTIKAQMAADVLGRAG